jgi:hypothetical protein
LQSAVFCLAKPSGSLASLHETLDFRRTDKPRGLAGMAGMAGMVGGAMPISVNPGPRAPSELRAAHSQGALPSFGMRGMDLCILDFSWTLGRETGLRFLAYLSARAPLKPLFPAQINNSIQPDYCLTSPDRPARRSNLELGVTNSRLSESCILLYSFSRTDLW